MFAEGDDATNPSDGNNPLLRSAIRLTIEPCPRAIRSTPMEGNCNRWMI